jgi:hypothetical protein
MLLSQSNLLHPRWQPGLSFSSVRYLSLSPDPERQGTYKDAAAYIEPVWYNFKSGFRSSFVTSFTKRIARSAALLDLR